MIGDESEVMCCFCGETIVESALDPCGLAVTTQWLLPSNSQFNQQWFCHAECFKDKMNFKASGSAYFADPTWRDTSESDSISLITTKDDPYIQWSREAETLYEVGKYLNREKHPIQVRISRELAERAIEAWRDEESGELPAHETHEQYHLRSAASALSLIGLTLEDGFSEDGDEVVFELDAWFVGVALEAADDSGLLTPDP